MEKLWIQKRKSDGGNMTDKKIKRSRAIILVAVIIIFVFLCSLYVYRVKKVNELIPVMDTVSYKLGDTINFEDDILINYPMTGYSIRVNEAHVFTYEEFLEKYNAKDEYTFVPDKIYEVNVTLSNNDAADDIGVSLHEFYIQKYGAVNSVDYNMLIVANPKLDGVTDIALRENSSIDINLTFGLYDYLYDKKAWDNIEDYGMNLVVTLYPTKKFVPLS